MGRKKVLSNSCHSPSLLPSKSEYKKALDCERLEGGKSKIWVNCREKSTRAFPGNGIKSSFGENIPCQWRSIKNWIHAQKRGSLWGKRRGPFPAFPQFSRKEEEEEAHKHFYGGHNYVRRRRERQRAISGGIRQTPKTCKLPHNTQKDLNKSTK